MPQVTIWRAIIACVILFAGLSACQETKCYQAANAESTSWLSVIDIFGYPLLEQRVPPAEGYEVTKGGVAHKTINGAATRSISLSQAQITELKELVSAVHGPSTGPPVDISCVVLITRLADGTSVEIAALPNEVNSIPVQVQMRLRAFFGPGSAKEAEKDP